MKNKNIPFFILSTCLFVSTKFFSQNTWIQKANFGGAERHGATGFSIGTKGYIGAGFTTNYNAQNDFWEWDQTTNAWTQKANIPGTRRAYAVSFSIGTKGYIGTGYDSTSSQGVTKDFYEYDPSINTWTQKANFGGSGRDAAIGFSIGSKGYIGTGDDGGSPTTIYFNDLWEYDPAIDTWTQKANFPGAVRSNAIGFSIGTKGYIGTGNDGTQFSDFWEYDSGTDAWTQKANFAGVARWGATGFSILNKGYIGIGRDSTNSTHSDFWEYDPSANVWNQKANVPGLAKWIATGFSIGNNGYLGTGADSYFTNLYTTFYEYTPSPAGIEEFSQTSVNIFPNPFTTSATFDLNKELKNAQLKLFDIIGKEVRSKNFSGKQIILQREKLESGIYFYRIISEDKTVSSGKVVAE